MPRPVSTVPNSRPPDPSKGEFKLKKGKSVEPKPAALLYSEMQDAGETFNIKVQVKEADIGRDDVWFLSSPRAGNGTDTQQTYGMFPAPRNILPVRRD